MQVGADRGPADRGPLGRRRHRRSHHRWRPASGAALLLTLGLLTGACEAGGTDPDPTPTASPQSGPPKRLTFGIWGPADEIAAYADVVEAYNSLSDDTEVALRSWPDHTGLMEALRSNKVPDVFLVARQDLQEVLAEKLNAPVDELLDERGVDFGDGYSRDALRAFAADNRLQCLPYHASPMVIYYNTELVDFERMAARGIEVPDPEDESPRWSFDTFVAAADFASRPRRGTRGLYVEPTLPGLAPFVFSGGGELFDSEDEPTSLAFSSEDTRSALERSLPLLRDPQLTLSEDQLAKRPALGWFKRGRLAMIPAYRSLVPELRMVQGLEFDVMPMPILDISATIGDIAGLCVSAEAASLPEAADFLVHAASAESVSRVASEGYLTPANLEVALSDDFLQPGRLPRHSWVFNTAVRSVRTLPLLDSWDELGLAVADTLREMVNVVVLDLDAVTERIDLESREVLDPEGLAEEEAESEE